MEKQENRRSE